MANLFSQIRGCWRHDIEPEQYVAELTHVVPYWPRDRHLELAPAYWFEARSRLLPIERSCEIGAITIATTSTPSQRMPN